MDIQRRSMPLNPLSLLNIVSIGFSIIIMKTFFVINIFFYQLLKLIHRKGREITSLVKHLNMLLY